MRRLVASWIEAEREHYGNALGKALEELNKDLNLSVKYSRVSEWRRGVYRPTQKVISFMLWRTLPWALKKAGLEASTAQLDHLDDLLWVTEIRNGEREYRFD